MYYLINLQPELINILFSIAVLLMSIFLCFVSYLDNWKVLRYTLTSIDFITLFFYKNSQSRLLWSIQTIILIEQSLNKTLK
jgi:hypothetical protein